MGAEYLWHSEADEVVPYKKQSIAIDAQNSALVTESYELTYSHATAIVFSGPKAKQNAKKWGEYVTSEEEGQPDYNTATTAAIKDCFGLGKAKKKAS